MHDCAIAACKMCIAGIPLSLTHLEESHLFTCLSRVMATGSVLLDHGFHPVGVISESDHPAMVGPLVLPCAIEQHQEHPPGWLGGQHVLRYRLL